MRTLMIKGLATTAAIAALACLAVPAGAQQPAGTAPWRAWLGCWTASPVSAVGVDVDAPLVCVTPTQDANAVLVTTLAEGKVVSTRTVDASGREVPLDAKGCSGTQTGRWSADGRRVYLSATATCDGVRHTTNGILAMTADGDWLDVQGVTDGGTENVRVARYRDGGLRGAVPADIAESLRDIGLAVQAARAAAGADVGTTAVVEASKTAGVAVTEAYVLARGQRFQLDAGQLVALADAGVSPRLTDAMIAVSNPQLFAVKAPAATDTADMERMGRRVYVTLDRYSPWGWGTSPYGYSFYDRYSPFGYGAYGAYGYGYYGYPGYTYGGPVVIVRADGSAPHGRVVKGRGYERGAGTTSSETSAERRSSRSPSPQSSGSAGSSGSSGSRSSGSSSSSGSGSSERTAKPRP